MVRIDIDPDCIDRYFSAPGKIDKTPKEFLVYLNDSLQTRGAKLHDGYAPFCKHIFVPNPYDVLPSAVDLAEHKSVIQTDYVARRPNELPVLTRFVRPSDLINRAPALCIDCILYSHEQMVKEYAAMKMDVASLPDCDWLVISLKFQNVNHETPMQPITMLRNTLIEEGGSGVGLDRDKYLESVDYWRKNVEVLNPSPEF